MLAYVNGARSAIHGVIAGFYWSATSDQGTLTNAWIVQLVNGFTSGTPKSGNQRHVCIR